MIGISCLTSALFTNESLSQFPTQDKLVNLTKTFQLAFKVKYSQINTCYNFFRFNTQLKILKSKKISWHIPRFSKPGLGNNGGG
jgi:hypothetical protein